MGTDPDEECLEYILRATANEAYAFLRDGLAGKLAAYAERGPGATEPVEVVASVDTAAFDELRSRCDAEGIALRVVDVDLGDDGEPMPGGATRFGFAEDALPRLRDIAEGLVAERVLDRGLRIEPKPIPQDELDAAVATLKEHGLDLGFSMGDDGIAEFRVKAKPGVDIVQALRASERSGERSTLEAAIERACAAERAAQASKDVKERVNKIEKVR